MKKVLLLFISVLFFSCNHSYFHFDEVIHYHKDISSSDIGNMQMDNQRNKDTTISKLVYLLTAYSYPEKLTDVDYLKILEENFDKKVVDEKYYDTLRSKVFIKIKLDSYEEYLCIAHYRDVLIMKKDGKITGIAKICFDCRQSYFLGSSSQKSLVTREQFENLKKILKVQ